MSDETRTRTGMKVARSRSRIVSRCGLRQAERQAERQGGRRPTALRWREHSILDPPVWSVPPVGHVLHLCSLQLAHLGTLVAGPAWDLAWRSWRAACSDSTRPDGERDHHQGQAISSGRAVHPDWLAKLSTAVSKLRAGQWGARVLTTPAPFNIEEYPLKRPRTGRRPSVFPSHPRLL